LDKTKASYQQDLEFIARAKNEKNAFYLLYNKYWEQLFLFIFKKVQSMDDAGDVCQTAMLKAMMNLPKYEDRGFPFSAWLYRIASNEVNLYFRKKKKEGHVEIKETHVKDLMGEIELGELSSVDDQEKLLLILADLKPNQAEIIEMRFFFSYSFKEIADFYKISEANAKMRLYRILDKLKQKWSNQ
jgi:RNA polymerase sigma-70 factor (ECF subfamily)